MRFAAAVVLLLALASVASARPAGLRSLQSAKRDRVFCSGPDYKEDGPDYKEDECPEHYECAPLDKEICKQVKVCKPNKYGKQQCTYKQECFKYACMEAPKYCEVSYDDEDECEAMYGKDLQCKKLDKEVCEYEKECKYVDTEVCKEYKYEKKCVYVDTKICLKYNQEQKCEKDRQVCKAYKQEKKCKPAQCAKYDKYGKCTAYGQEDCEYVDTKECKVYDTVKGKCKYVNTTCKEYKQEEKCKDVKKGCKVYEQKEVCDDVKVCWTGKCVEVHKKASYPKKAKFFGK